jgi:hypothetical protein
MSTGLHGSDPAALPEEQVLVYLRRLPEPVPPPVLGPRIVARARARRRWRRVAPPLALAAAAAVLMLVPLRTELPEAVPRAPEAEVLVELRALDRQLQAAYAADAQARIEALWVARNALARRVEAPPGSSGGIVRL